MDENTIIKEKSEKLLKEELAEVLRRWERGDMRTKAEKEYNKEVLKQRRRDSGIDAFGRKVLPVSEHKTQLVLPLAFALALLAGVQLLTGALFGEVTAETVTIGKGLQMLFWYAVPLSFLSALIMFTGLKFSSKQWFCIKVLLWTETAIWLYDVYGVWMLYGGNFLFDGFAVYGLAAMDWVACFIVHMLLFLIFGLVSDWVCRLSGVSGK